MGSLYPCIKTELFYQGKIKPWRLETGATHSYQMGNLGCCNLRVC